MQQRVVVFSEHAGQAAPALGGVAQAVVFGNRAAHATAFQVVNGTRRFLEPGLVGLAGFFQHFAQAGVLVARGGCALAVLGAALLLGHRQARALGQLLYGFDKAHAAVLHQKANRIAVFAATKAVKELFGRTDAERRRLFPVKGAQAHEVGAALFELHIAPDDVHDINACEQLLEEGGGDRHGGIFADLPVLPSAARAAETPRFYGLLCMHKIFFSE